MVVGSYTWCWSSEQVNICELLSLTMNMSHGPGSDTCLRKLCQTCTFFCCDTLFSRFRYMFGNTCLTFTFIYTLTMFLNFLESFCLLWECPLHPPQFVSFRPSLVSLKYIRIEKKGKIKPHKKRKQDNHEIKKRRKPISHDNKTASKWFFGENFVTRKPFHGNQRLLITNFAIAWLCIIPWYSLWDEVVSNFLAVYLTRNQLMTFRSQWFQCHSCFPSSCNYEAD